MTKQTDIVYLETICVQCVSDVLLQASTFNISGDLQLLAGGATGFNALAEAAHELADWEPYAEIVCYRRFEQERRLIEAEITELTGHCALLQESISNCRGQLEAGGVPFLLHNLEGRAELPRHQGFPRRGRRGHFGVGGAPI